MGYQRRVHGESREDAHNSSIRMVGGTSGGNWKRPVNRMYTYNYQAGENYYLPMTSYLESKNTGATSDLPGPLCFSESIAEFPLSGKSTVVTSVSSSTHTSETTISSTSTKTCMLGASQKAKYPPGDHPT